MLLSHQRIAEFDELGKFVGYLFHPLFTLTSGNLKLYAIVIPGILFLILFSLLPPLFLALYPMKLFRVSVSKCRLNSITFNIFADKIYSCYRNGLNGGRDLRSFSALYFFVRLSIYLVAHVCVLLSKETMFMATDIWFPLGTLFLITALSIATVRPYTHNYMNILDTLLLSNLALASYDVSAKFNIHIIPAVLFSIPIIIFILMFLLKFLKLLFWTALRKCCKLPTLTWMRTLMLMDEQGTDEERQPII